MAIPPDALAWGLAQPAGSIGLAQAEMYTSGVMETRLSDGRGLKYRSQTEIGEALLATYLASQGGATRRPARTIAVVGDGFR